MKNILLAILLFWATWHVSSAQSGQIEGMVFDGKTKETLVGAQILVEGTTTGAVTNRNGEFVINNVPEGYHTLSLCQ